jgi:predicted TPR repeat methyltransferase
VLDIGCVAHDAAEIDSSSWLHARLAAAAQLCIGVDVLEQGLEVMRRRGYEVVLHDLRTGLGTIADKGPFDVIVAGELIEHVESLDMLFDVASALLASDGQLIITTPNPYAPHRVRAGQRGIVWENVDHILYAFPSGIAELAERHGLVLSEATTARTDDGSRRSAFAQRIRDIARGVVGSKSPVGFSSLGEQKVRRVHHGSIVELLHGISSPRPRFLGETFVYVVRRSNAG